MGKSKYQTEEERKAAKKEYMKLYNKQYRQKNAEAIKEAKKNDYLKNKDRYLTYWKSYYRNSEKVKEYRKSKKGRANSLINAYRQSDKKHNRGECTLTAEWIVENIFISKCYYCGESDWAKLGADRIDNSKPHTPDNVVPCCAECNIKKIGKNIWKIQKK